MKYFKLPEDVGVALMTYLSDQPLKETLHLYNALASLEEIKVKQRRKKNEQNVVDIAGAAQ